MTESEFNELVQQFSDRTLSVEDWTHQAHIMVAFWHNGHFEFEEAVNQVRRKIIQYNKAVGTPNTDTSGYHESLTIFWMMLTKNVLLESPNEALEKVCADFLDSQYSLKSVPLEYYSKNVLFSIKARREWVNGDIKQIHLRGEGRIL